MREQSIKDVLGTGIKFHEELPRVKKGELLGERFALCDAKIIDDWDSKWGISEFALLLVRNKERGEVTTLCGGRAVVRQVRRLQKWGKLPGRVWCFLDLQESENGQYYLLNWDDKTPGEEEEEKEPVETVEAPVEMVEVPVETVGEPVETEESEEIPVQ